MSKKFYFVRTVDESGDRKGVLRTMPVKGQFFDDGTPVRDDWHVACPKEIRYRYPEGTVFATEALDNIGGTHYSASRICVVSESAQVASDVPSQEMLEAWRNFTPAESASGEEKEETAAGKPKAKTLLDTIREAYKAPSIKKNKFFVSKHDWELIARNILKGINTMLVGPSGTGKTELVMEAAKQLGYQLCCYDMGSMHDPMTQMLGTHRIDADHKSVFDYAQFVYDVSEAPAPGFAGKIILLDELSRAPLTTANILFPCLDSRRMLPVEMAGSDATRKVDVHESVVFIATANVGSEYTGTSSMDKALVNRFFPLELNYMPEEQEVQVLQARCGIALNDAKNIVRVCTRIRDLFRKEEISNDVSTRESLRCAEMVADGYGVTDALRDVILPIFSGSETDGEKGIVSKVFMAY